MGLKVENPPPVVMTPPSWLWQATSGPPVLGPIVAPTAVTQGDVAGNDGK